MGFTPQETPDIIALKQRYRSRAMACHPDVDGGSHAAMQELVDAFEVLSDGVESAAGRAARAEAEAEAFQAVVFSPRFQRRMARARQAKEAGEWWHGGGADSVLGASLGLAAASAVLTAVLVVLVIVKQRRKRVIIDDDDVR
jgi:curved DNA-binding protein CbpA